MQPKVIKRADHPISRKNIDADAIKVLYRLYNAGYTAYLVGGGVRDMLLGRTPKDFDVATSARPAQIKKLFRRGCILVGRRFRLAHVRFGNKVIEVSTFRREPDIEAGARENGDDNHAADEGYISSDNTFGTPELDAQRRDFTINSLFYNIGDYSLLDYCDGVKDLEDRVIRTIGDPQVRFREDPVRMIRAIKFCARLGFKMDVATWKGITDNCQCIANASVARVQEEIRRLLESKCSAHCFAILDDSGLLEVMIPEVYGYLERASEGQVAHDEGCQLLWSLLEELDKQADEHEDREELRFLACLVLMLPLVLEAGLTECEFSDSCDKVVNSLSARLGICYRQKCVAKQVFSIVARLMRGAGGRIEAQFFNRSAFATAYTLYAMLVKTGVVPPEELEAWQDRLDEHRQKQRETPAKEAAQAYISKRNRHRRGKRRGEGRMHSRA